MPEIELWGQANSWRGCGRFEFTDIPYLTSLSLGAARCITMKALISQLLTYYWIVRFFTSLPNLASTPSYPSENFCKDSGEGNAKSRFLLALILLQVAHEMPVTCLPFCQVLYVMSLSLMFGGSAPIQCRQSPRRRATAPSILQVSNPSDSRLSSSLLLKHASSHHELPQQLLQNDEPSQPANSTSYHRPLSIVHLTVYLIHCTPCSTISRTGCLYERRTSVSRVEHRRVHVRAAEPIEY